MVNIIKNNTNMGIFILESDAVTNDDWVTDHDDMAEADLDLFTEGTNYIHLPYTEDIKRVSNYTVEVIQLFRGQNEPIGLGQGHFLYKAEGILTGTASELAIAEGKIEEFFKRHLMVGDNYIYIGLRHTSTVWRLFRNHAYASKNYCRGLLVDFHTHRDGKHQYINWRIVFQEGW